MTEDIRTPGRVDEEGVSIDNQVSNEGAYSKDKPVNTLKKLDADRDPQKIEEQADPIPLNDQDQELELLGSENLILKSESGPWAVMFWLLAIFVTTWLLYSTAQSLVDILRQSIWIGIPITAISVAFFIALVLLVIREIKAVRAVDQLSNRKSSVIDAVNNNDIEATRRIFNPILYSLRETHPVLITEFEDATRSLDSPADYISQLDNIVYTQLEDEAEDVIKKSAFSSALGVAALPHPALDASFVIWRSVVLIRQVARIYGVRLTGLSALLMLKHSISNAIIAAGVSQAGDMLLEQTSDSIISKTFKSLGEGAVIAWRVYRLGKRTQDLCRVNLEKKTDI